MGPIRKQLTLCSLHQHQIQNHLDANIWEEMHVRWEQGNCLKSQKSTTKRSTESSVTHPRHDAWYGLVTHTSLGKRDLRHTHLKWTHKTQSRTMGRHGYLRHVKCAPGWSGHVKNTVPAQSTRWIKRKKRKMRSRRGIWAARWMSRSYLSIRKICWRWGSDRCPFRMLPHAAWVWKEQERRKGHWALAWNKLTQGKKYISHMKGLRRSNQIEAATHKSTRT